MPVLVEGKYDKLKLRSLVDGPIFTTEGFRLFGDSERLAFFRRLAETQGLAVLTDSDGAGFRIRSYITEAIGKGGVTHVYTPDVFGREKRKEAPSAEGKLGVEGICAEALLHSLERAGVLEWPAESSEPAECGGEGAASGSGIPPNASARKESPLTKSDLYALGLCGRADSASRRAALLRELELPAHLTPTGLLDALNLLTDRAALEAVCARLGEADAVK